MKGEALTLATFSILDPPTECRTRRGLAFICAVLVQVLMIGTAFLAGVVFPDQLQLTDKQYPLVIWLSDSTPSAKPIISPPRQGARVLVSASKLPVPPKPLASSAPVLEVPKILHTIPPVLPPATPFPAPPVRPPSPPPKAQEQLTVHTGLLGGAEEPVPTKPPVEQVQTGGFGSPQELPSRAQREDPGNAPKLGSFGLAEGPGTGNGTSGRDGIPTVIASAGFGSAAAGVGNGFGGGRTDDPRVKTAGFEKTPQVTTAPAKNPEAPPAEVQPIEILSKPSPVYTEEARRLKIQGDVALSVVFLANRTIKVTGVVISLGHGLDQAAEEAATRIRFKPALRGGQPTDFPATLRIKFRLADQSS